MGNLQPAPKFSLKASTSKVIDIVCTKCTSNLGCAKRMMDVATARCPCSPSTTQNVVPNCQRCSQNRMFCSACDPGDYERKAFTPPPAFQTPIKSAVNVITPILPAVVVTVEKPAIFNQRGKSMNPNIPIKVRDMIVQFCTQNEPLNPEAFKVRFDAFWTDILEPFAGTKMRCRSEVYRFIRDYLTIHHAAFTEQFNAYWTTMIARISF